METRFEALKNELKNKKASVEVVGYFKRYYTPQNGNDNVFRIKPPQGESTTVHGNELYVTGQKNCGSRGTQFVCVNGTCVASWIQSYNASRPSVVECSAFADGEYFQITEDEFDQLLALVAEELK